MIKQNNRFISIEGNIGTGKSTLIPKLVAELNEQDDYVQWQEIQEPVDDPKFMELLQEFYDKPNCTIARLEFQMYITERRARLVQDLRKDQSYIIERSLLSDLVFSQANFLSMECPEGKYLTYYYDIKRRLKEYPFLSDVLYLRCDPKISLGRVQQRGRGGEGDIPLSYMEDVHNFHEACLPQICREYGSHLHTFDWSSFGDVQWLVKAILDNT